MMPPTSAAPAPTRIVMRMPISCLPGTSRRASGPRISPANKATMMVEIQFTSQTSYGGERRILWARGFCGLSANRMSARVARRPRVPSGRPTLSRRVRYWRLGSGPNRRCAAPLTSSMFAVYRLALRNPARPPAAALDRLREELPGVEIGADGQALVFMAEHPDLGERVRSAAELVCGDEAWTDIFHPLDNGPGAA